MRVNFQPKITKSNNIQSKQKSFVSAPAKADTVSFTGGKAGFAEELLGLIPKVGKEMIHSVEYTESGHFVHSDGFVDMVRTRIDLLGKSFRLIEKTKVKNNWFNWFGKESEKSYSIHRSDARKGQNITEEQYKKITEQVRAFAFPAILEKHGIENKTVSKILNNLGYKLSKQKINAGHSSVYQDEAVRLDSEYFVFPNKKMISLIYNNNAEKPLYKMGFKSFEENHMDVISITNPKEIEEMKRVIELRQAFDKKNGALRTQTRLQAAIQTAEDALETFEKGMYKTIDAADKIIANASEHFKAQH